MRKFIPVILIAILGIAVVWNRAYVLHEETHRVLDLNTVRKILPQTSQIEHRLTPYAHYLIYETSQETGEKVFKGYAFLTTDITPHIMGYAGPLMVLVGMDASGHIRGIRVLEHHETPAYVYGIDQDWWLKQFIGLGPESDISPEGKIDAISSATVTVRALCRSVEESLQRMATEILMREKAKVSAMGRLKIFNHFDSYAVVVLFILSVLAYVRSWSFLRNSLLAVSLLYLGFKLKLLYSVAHISSLIQSTMPSFDIAPLLWIFLGLIFVTGIFFGRIYCGFLCPFGVLQEFLHFFSPWRVSVDPLWDHWLKKIKYFLLWLIVTTALVYPALHVTNYETFALTFALHGTTGAWSLAVGVLVFSFFIERFYCRYFCLAGASLGLLNKISLSRLVIGKQCRTCRSCEILCPTQAIHEFKIDTEECVLCNRCRQACAATNIRVAVCGKPKD